LDLYCSEECKVLHESVIANVKELRRMVSDHDQRFDTLQTPFWKRLVFWLDGWPWHDLNANAPAPRPWRRWWTS
jgi:hypothetical protein